MNKQAQVRAAFILKQALSDRAVLGGSLGLMVAPYVAALLGGLEKNPDAEADDAFGGYLRGSLRGGLTAGGGLLGAALARNTVKDKDLRNLLALAGGAAGAYGGHVGSRALLGEYGYKPREDDLLKQATIDEDLNTVEKLRLLLGGTGMGVAAGTAGVDGGRLIQKSLAGKYGPSLLGVENPNVMNTAAKKLLTSKKVVPAAALFGTLPLAWWGGNKMHERMDAQKNVVERLRDRFNLE